MTGQTPNYLLYGKTGVNADPIQKKIGLKATLSCDYRINLLKREADTLYGLKCLECPHGKRLVKGLRKQNLGAFFGYCDCNRNHYIKHCIAVSNIHRHDIMLKVLYD